MCQRNLSGKFKKFHILKKTTVITNLTASYPLCGQRFTDNEERAKAFTFRPGNMSGNIRFLRNQPQQTFGQQTEGSTCGPRQNYGPAGQLVR
jgi:hypothetical protein